MTVPLAHVGYAAALSVVLLVLALAMAIVLQIRGRRRSLTD
jgi:raffinose/stachyose/melibiose transport system permease protein